MDWDRRNDKFGNSLQFVHMHKYTLKLTLSDRSKMPVAHRNKRLALLRISIETAAEVRRQRNALIHRYAGCISERNLTSPTTMY